MIVIFCFKIKRQRETSSIYYLSKNHSDEKGEELRAIDHSLHGEK